MLNLLRYRALAVLLAVSLTACVGTAPLQSTDSGRYELENDSPVLEAIDLDAVEAVIPQAVLRSQAGNTSPYTVDGKTYHVMASETGYRETGIASWYGRKFHGHLTSNGEVYDMFQLSAAHRSLPIPSFLRVTNLENRRSVIVRVNDRGPFHDDRIVDLSYAAATMLGFAEAGTAEVQIEAITPPGDDEYLQVGAFSKLDSARELMDWLSGLTSLPVFIRSDSAGDSGEMLHRVRLGPLNETIEIQSLIQRIIDAGLGIPFRITQ